MNRMMVICMILSMVLILPADGEELFQEMNGLVTEVTQDGFSLLTEDGIRFVAITEQSVMHTTDDLKLGDLVTVYYHGDTERRMVTAVWVRCFHVTGIIAEITDAKSFLLQVDSSGQTLLVQARDTSAVAVGECVTVYYNGMVTRSNPGKINALFIPGPILVGTIEELISDDMLLLETELEHILLKIPDFAVVLAELIPGERIWTMVGPAAAPSIPPQYEAYLVLAESK